MARSDVIQQAVLRWEWKYSHVEDLLSHHPVALQIAKRWATQGADPAYLRVDLSWVLEMELTWQEAKLKAQLHKKIASIAKHLSKARAGLLAFPRLPRIIDPCERTLIDRHSGHIDELLHLLGLIYAACDPLDRGRIGERHLTRFMFDLSEHLTEKTGRPQWGKIAAFMNDLGLQGKQLTYKQVEQRCGGYQRHRTDAP